MGSFLDAILSDPADAARSASETCVDGSSAAGSEDRRQHSGDR
ncbi:hypothetical protein SynA18461_01521 [Synechococcus sp. A18-46.1]|nr:hypothetical protein SynA18461_01521 [Synechococcus sp. A18-46.1]